jgi:hypothetical protein
MFARIGFLLVQQLHQAGTLLADEALQRLDLDVRRVDDAGNCCRAM